MLSHPHRGSAFLTWHRTQPSCGTDYFSALHLPRPLCHQDRSGIIEDPLRPDRGYCTQTWIHNCLAWSALSFISCGWMKRKYWRTWCPPTCCQGKTQKSRKATVIIGTSTSGNPLTRPRSKPVNRRTAQSSQHILTIYYSSAVEERYDWWLDLTCLTKVQNGLLSIYILFFWHSNCKMCLQVNTELKNRKGKRRDWCGNERRLDYATWPIMRNRICDRICDAVWASTKRSEVSQNSCNQAKL